MRASLIPILLSGPIANRLLGSEPSGMAISFVDGSMVIRDPTTAANNFQGKYTDKLTIVGSLPWGSQGAHFDDTHYASILTSAFPYADGAAGTFLMRYIPDAVPSAAQAYFWAFSDGTTNNRIAQFIGAAASQLTHRVVATASATVSTAGSQTEILNKNATGAAWAANDYRAYLNGVNDVTDATVTLPTGITRLSLGRNEALAANPALVNILSALYVPRAMPAAEAAARIVV